MNKLSKSLLLVTLALGMQGCKDLAKDLFGFEDEVNVDELVALDVRVTSSDVVQEQTDWSIRADINLSVGDVAPEYQANWQIVDAPAGFNMPLEFVPANDEGQTFLNFRTPDVDEETEVTLQLTVDYNNGNDDEQIVKEVELKIEANQEVVISGAVVDEPIPFAKVTVVIGDLVFETEADGNGNYTIELEFKDNSLIALVTAEGSGDYSEVEFKSYLGDGETLTQQAGSDGILTAADNDNITVSNISTAEFVLIENVLDEGEEITSQEQLDQLASELDTQEVLEIAAVIKAIVDEGAELPEGTDTVLDLLQDEEATEEFVEELLEENPNIIDDLVNEIIEDPVLNPEDPSLDITQRFFATKLGDYQNLTSEIINLEDGGTGDWSTYYGTFDVTWSKLEKGYSVNFEDNAWINTTCNNETNICRDRFLKSAVVTTLPDSGAYKSIIVDYTYSDVNTVNSADVVMVDASSTYSLVSEKELIPFDAAELTASKWAIRVLDESLDNSNFNNAEIPFSTTYATFNEDGSGTYNRVLDNQVVNFTWRIEGIDFFGLTINLLEIDVKASDNEDTTDHTMVYAQTYDRLGVRQTNLLIDAQDFMKVPEKMLNTTVSMSATMSPVDDSIDIPNTPLVGRYALLASATEEPDFFLQFNGDSTGFQEFFTSDGETFTSDFMWKTTDRGLIAEYYSPKMSNAGIECHEENMEECFVSRERTFEVLGIQEDNYIVRMAQVWYRYDSVSGETYGDYYSSYIGIYQRLNQKIEVSAGTKVLISEDGQVAQKSAFKMELNADGTGMIYADAVHEVTWQQVNEYQVDMTFLSGSTTEVYNQYCNVTGETVEVTMTSTTDRVTLYGAPTKMLPDSREARWWAQSFGTDTFETTNAECAGEFNRTEDWVDMEAFNIMDGSKLIPLTLDNGQYVINHESEMVNTDSSSAIHFSVAVELMADGSVTNIADDRELTLAMDNGTYVFSHGDVEYHYAEYFEMLDKAYYALSTKVDENGNKSMNAQLIVPITEESVTEAELMGQYADVSNGYESEVWYWFALNDNNEGGMGREDSNWAWLWGVEENATSLTGKETALTAVTADRYSYVFYDEDANGQADDINDDGVIDWQDVNSDYQYSRDMSVDGYQFQRDCKSNNLVCLLFNDRNYYVIQAGEKYNFMLRDTEWYLPNGTGMYSNRSFGMWVWEKVDESPLPGGMMSGASKGLTKAKSHAHLPTEEQKMNMKATKALPLGDDK